MSRQAHSFTGKICHWFYCTRCGLLALKNDATRRAKPPFLPAVVRSVRAATLREKAGAILALASLALILHAILFR